MATAYQLDDLQYVKSDFHVDILADLRHGDCEKISSSQEFHELAFGRLAPRNCTSTCHFMFR